MNHRDRIFIATNLWLDLYNINTIKNVGAVTLVADQPNRTTTDGM